MVIKGIFRDVVLPGEVGDRLMAGETMALQDLYSAKFWR